MKKSMKLILTAILMAVMLAVFVSAEVALDYKIETVESPADTYKLVLTLTDTEAPFAGMKSTLTFDYSTIKPVHRLNGDVVDIATQASSTTPCKLITKKCDTGEVDPETLEPVLTNVMRTVASWTVNGNTASLYNETAVTTPQDKDGAYQWIDATTGLVVYELYFKFAEGKTLSDVKASTFVLDNVEYGNWKSTGGSTYYYVANDENKQTIGLSNNTYVEVVTIPVVAGNVIYLKDGTRVVAETTGDYELPSGYTGYVAVNTVASGVQTAQKVYSVANGTATAEENYENGAITTGVASIVYNSEVATKTGLRYQAKFGSELKNYVSEFGFIATVESAKVENILEDNGMSLDNYTLDLDLVDIGAAAAGITYNPDKNINLKHESEDVNAGTFVYYALVTSSKGIDITVNNVLTYVALRPYYKLTDGTVIYGEVTKNTIYDVAVDIKNNDATTYALYQEYIDSIIDVVGGDVIISGGDLFAPVA